MVTKAEDKGDHYLLNGAKMWITNGTIADLAVVWAKLDGVIRGFIVEKGDEGFSAPEMKGKHSLKASVTSELVFQDCKIPKDRMLPGVKGLRGPFSCLNNARYGISWGALGSAMACFHSAKTYAMSRIQFDHPIASYQLVQNKLAWMLVKSPRDSCWLYHLGKKKDDGSWFPEQISLAKMNNVDIALEIARVSRDIHGANGILDEYPVMRHMANLESVKTYEGTHDIHNLILGRYITGIQAFTRKHDARCTLPRLALMVVKNTFRKREVFDHTTSYVWTFRPGLADLDVYPEVNNGRHFVLFDLARYDLAMRTGLFGGCERLAPPSWWPVDHPLPTPSAAVAAHANHHRSGRHG